MHVHVMEEGHVSEFMHGECNTHNTAGHTSCMSAAPLPVCTRLPLDIPHLTNYTPIFG